jgi:hypothetical protein
VSRELHLLDGGQVGEDLTREAGRFLFESQ